MSLLLLQLWGELWKLFARKRTWLGFGVFLGVEILILVLWQLPRGQRWMKRMIEQEALFGRDAYPLAEMLEDVRASVWRELAAGEPMDPFRRNLQRGYVNRMEALLANEEARATDIAPLVRGQLPSDAMALHHERHRLLPCYQTLVGPIELVHHRRRVASNTEGGTNFERGEARGHARSTQALWRERGPVTSD